MFISLITNFPKELIFLLHYLPLSHIKKLKNDNPLRRVIMNILHKLLQFYLNFDVETSTHLFEGFQLILLCKTYGEILRISQIMRF
jgi:hypothetical protein